MASNLIGTLLSSQVTDARTTRPRTYVLIGCDPALSGPAVVLLSCFALDLSRSSAFFAISCDFRLRLVSPPSAFSILADRFCVLRFHLAFDPLRNSRSAAVLQNCIGTCFRLQIGRSPAVRIAISGSDTKRPRRGRHQMSPQGRSFGDDLTFGLALAEDHPG